MSILTAFPRLATEPWKRTSNPSATYNCIGWAADDAGKWWWPTPGNPDHYWPPGVPVAETLDAFVAAYATCGYSPCADASVQPGQEKIALYALGGVVKHAARQLRDGSWTSKLGANIDIAHTLNGLAGGLYGDPALYLSRPTTGSTNRTERNRQKRRRRARRGRK